MKLLFILFFSINAYSVTKMEKSKLAHNLSDKQDITENIYIMKEGKSVLNSNGKLNFGYSSKKEKLKIKFNEVKSLNNNVVLFFEAPFSNDLIFYKNGTKVEKGKYGEVYLDIKDKNQIIVEKNNRQRLDGKVFLFSKEKFDIHIRNSFDMNIVFFGGFLFLTIYNFFFYLITKRISQLYYVFFNITFTVIILILNNFFYKTSLEMLQRHPFLFSGSAMILFTLFTKEFLSWEKHKVSKKYIRYINFLLYLIGSLIISESFLRAYIPPLGSIIDFFLFLTLISVSSSIFVLWKKNKFLTRIYLISSIFNIVGGSVWFLYYAGLMPDVFLVRNSLLIGCSFEMICFSIGLAYEYKQLMIEKNHAKLEANEKRRYQNLLRIVSHDISNPLTSARMSLDCKDMLPDFEETLSSSLDKIENIIKNIRVEEKDNSISQGSIKGIDAYKSLKKTFDLRLKEKGISLVYEGNKNISIPINENVFLNSLGGNLLSNAIKFSFKNSKIIFNVKEESDFIVISVQDFGSGMPQDVYQKILKGEMVTTKGLDNEEGTGFGTNIIRGLMDDYEGKIDVQTKHQSDSKNHGTKFILSFPKIN